MESKNRGPGGGGGPRRNLKMHQVHELADAKLKESERLRQALKIGKDYEEGSHWRRQESACYSRRTCWTRPTPSALGSV